MKVKPLLMKIPLKLDADLASHMRPHTALLQLVPVPLPTDARGARDVARRASGQTSLGEFSSPPFGWQLASWRG